MVQTDAKKKLPLVIQDQGTFYFGGRTIKGDHGDFAKIDHGFVEYQIPANPRKYPLVMWHGGGQSGKTWESTPDGRDGYQQIFTRRGFPVYIIDQAGRARGGRLEKGVTLGDAAPGASSIWNVFRIGPWSPPEPRGYFPGVQFSQSNYTLDQYYRQTSVSTGPEDRDPATRNLHADNIIDLFKTIGPSVLICHSNSGQYSWLAASKAPNLVKAVVAYEPENSFAFPSDNPPPDIKTNVEFLKTLLTPQLLPPEQFKQLTKMPIVIIYGDNIEFDTPSDVFGVELWRVNVKRARQFVKAVNDAGGDAKIVFLPRIGIKGNTHFPFSDLNNIKVADHLSAWLKENNLSER